MHHDRITSYDFSRVERAMIEPGFNRLRKVNETGLGGSGGEAFEHWESDVQES